MSFQHTDTLEAALKLNNEFHNVSHKWILWAHLPHNIDWTLKSYIQISTFSTLEEIIAVTELLPSSLIENCMLFMMKQGISPMWEDPKNRNGGYFSYKVLNKNVAKAWTELTYRIVGGSISNELSFVKNVNGITIPPKKNFCIIKIWMCNCDHQNSSSIVSVKGLPSQGCLFKKHTPEY
jgi:hypothetical protein